MGPGILLKSLSQGSFSLMVFGWAQIVMDIQPLIVLIIGEGHLHGFSHTFIGATLIAIIAGLTGKYLSELGLWLLRITRPMAIKISWGVVFFSSFVGSYSHVIIDGVMHHDVQPFYPFTLDNMFLGLVSVSTLHSICFYTALLGAAIYYAIQWYNQER